MALPYSKNFYLLFYKSSKKCIQSVLGNKIQHILPVVHYSDSADVSKIKISKAMKIYIENNLKFDEFMKQQLQEFEFGKKFLAGMMGGKSKEMSQKDIDNAIEYLFPSALFVHRARPMMKPPEEIFGSQISLEFDVAGRPNHYLFYTLKPNFSQCLHDAAKTLERLNGLLYQNKTPPQQLILEGGKWFTKLELSKKFSEKLFDIEYDKFIEIFNKLGEHPFALEAEDFIKSYWKSSVEKTKVGNAPIVVRKDNITVSTVTGVRRKTSTATVSVSSPGKGKIQINNLGIDYFINITPREQV